MVDVAGRKGGMHVQVNLLEAVRCRGEIGLAHRLLVGAGDRAPLRVRPVDPGSEYAAPSSAVNEANCRQVGSSTPARGSTRIARAKRLVDRAGHRPEEPGI